MKKQKAASQIKVQDTTPEKQLKEVEIGDLPEKVPCLINSKNAFFLIFVPLKSMYVLISTDLNIVS